MAVIESKYHTLSQCGMESEGGPLQLDPRLEELCSAQQAATIPLAIADFLI